jgi:hypothetical protein
MAAAQPANTTISVFYRLRLVRDNHRHTSIKHLTTPFDVNYVAVPGEETQVVETRDPLTRSDAFRYGKAVVVSPRKNTSLAQVLAAVPDIDFPVRMVGNPREVQIQKTAAHKTDDFYAQVRAVAPGGYHTA